MEVQCKQPTLPKLRMSEESNRRDSLSSSRTGDSGYNSDPDISLSPLDFRGLDKGPVTAFFQHPLPSSTFEYVDFEAPACAKPAKVSKGAYRSILQKRYGEEQKTALVNKFEVTSNPTCPSAVHSTEKPDWTYAFKNPSDVRKLDNTSLKDNIKTSRKEGVELWIDESIPSHRRPEERVLSIVSLSSTSSADMYSVTEDSDEEEASELGPSILSKATLKTIELIMRKIEVNLAYAAYIQCAGGQTSRGHSGTGEVSRNTGRGTGQGGAGGKRKSRTDESTPSSNPDDDGPTKRRRVSIATTEDSETGPRFACPFYKHDPDRYRHRRTCPGPGWPTVHRMKEHLYRAHAKPILCPRCYTMFDSDNELAVHLRSNPCLISAPQPIDGIDRETLIGLRKRSPALRLEEDKWRDAYRLLFPDVDSADIPSPYYDSNSPTEESRRFRRELLKRIRHELFATAEQETGPVEQNLLRQVADIIQRCESELLSSLHPVPVPTHSHPQPSLPPTTQQPPPPSPYPSNPLLSRPSTQPPPRARPAPATTTGGYQNARIPITAPSQFFPEPPPAAQNTSFMWEEHPQTPSSEWIDWNAVFPPAAPETQVQERGQGPLTTLATPVWT
ncbi:hypothetical protein K505DRAFT_334452 [Melanomma pulvis-pyrius CBS 109.77]|uniref:C2H2-type domain-containing protein n=1 Tax=Melanomma pulvis-pyrius CBS 109.77 TaxID=1314802 RepID=A0A6A6XMW0_9PLEO|nr:hypothetical protein K505DRAFT_334452 [Melanomma pulvis-pyrius CBS 109.77]